MSFLLPRMTYYLTMMKSQYMQSFNVWRNCVRTMAYRQERALSVLSHGWNFTWILLRSAACPFFREREREPTGDSVFQREPNGFWIRQGPLANSSVSWCWTIRMVRNTSRKDAWGQGCELSMLPFCLLLIINYLNFLQVCLLHIISHQVLALADGDREHKDVAYADIYHSANRYNCGPCAHLPVVLPSSVMYSFKRNRLLLGFLVQIFESNNA